MTWTISNFQIEINYYYNSDLNLKKMLQRLNSIANEIVLESYGRKRFLSCAWITDFLGIMMFKTNKY